MSKSSIIPIPPLDLSDPSASSDSLMGLQLTEQYHRAVGGMREVLRFGCMMMALREKLSTRGQLHAGRPKSGETDHIAPWLEEFAPEVKRATAYRFLHVAEAVAQDFQTPARITFAELATKPAEELPEKLRLKQAELWDFIEGTSQRSWLDRFAPHKSKGGYHPRQGPEPTLEETIARLKKAAEDSLRSIGSQIESFALSNRKEGFDLLGDHDKQIFRDLILDLYQTHCRK